MAHSSAMGPPTSPREPRRSGRRSAHSTSTSTSKSPDSETGPPSAKEHPQRPSLTSNNSTGSRGRRLKQEELEEPAEDTNHDGEEDEEEEQGVTRCVCGKSEDDPDAGEFMVQCETCKVWQHGGCMGYNSEDQLQNSDYYCELCRPDLHVELLSRKSKKRQSSATSHHTAARHSRSHSPSLLLKQPAKRRNTMNSRDAAFDENLEEILKSTAAEAGAANDHMSNGNVNGHVDAGEDEQEALSGVRKKRRRADDDPPAKKRTRSMSTTSENAPTSAVARDETPGQPGSSKGTSVAPSLPPPTKNVRTNKRGGRKNLPPEPLVGLDGLEAPPPPAAKTKSHRKGAGAKRAPASSAANSAGQGNQDNTGRRGQANGVNGQAASSAATDKSYRNSHAYAVSQQPLYTSWNLPDYLAHLEEMLPSDTPQPLEIPGGRASSQERTQERGVKIKWPGKRMSVGDMNKRVRALVEWVGREQANALDRGRRMEALEKALKEAHLSSLSSDEPMIVDASEAAIDVAAVEKGQLASVFREVGNSDSEQTMKLMEELMEELIGFQERFGPGSKARERERRLAS